MPEFDVEKMEEERLAALRARSAKDAATKESWDEAPARLLEVLEKINQGVQTLNDTLSRVAKALETPKG